MIANLPITEIDDKIKAIIEQNRVHNTIVRYNWTVKWGFYHLDGQEIDSGDLNFLASSKADEFIKLLRKKALVSNIGIIVTKIDLKKKRSKTYRKGYNRRW